jgi:hypothetical protein
VVLPAGVVTVDNPVYLRDGDTLTGTGVRSSILKAADDATRKYILLDNIDDPSSGVGTGAGNSRLEVANLVLDGNYAARPATRGTATLLRIAAPDTAPCSDVSVHDTTLAGAGFAALQIMSCTHVTVRGNLVSDALRDGITVWFNSRDVTIDANTITGVRDDCIGLGSEGSGHTGTRLRTVTVTGNACTQAADSVNGNGVDIAGAADVTVAGNTIGYVQGWGVVTQGGWNSHADLPAQHIRIVHNTTSNGGRAITTGGGIFVDANNTDVTVAGNHITNPYAYGMRFLAATASSGNTIAGGQTGDTIGIGVQASGVTSSADTVTGSPSMCLWLAADAVTVTGAQVSGCATAQPANPAVLVKGSNVSVQQSQIARGGTAASLFGARVSSPGTYAGDVITGNIFTGYTAATATVDQSALLRRNTTGPNTLR